MRSLSPHHELGPDTTPQGGSHSRRRFLASIPGLLALNPANAEQAKRRPQLAVVTTIYRKRSHAQHIVDSFLEGYGWQSGHHHPPMDIVSLYVDQVGDNDLSRERARRHPQMRLYPTIAEALTRGGNKLAVDGVLLIGEHGNYRRNEKRQTLYPRYEFFKQIVDVFRQSGRTVPVFNDKHLSWKWEWAREMADTAKAMGFPFMAGSSVPVAWRLPPVDIPLGAQVEEALCVNTGSVDSYDFHMLEAVQCLVERRKGGETGVVALQTLRGEKVWQALQTGSWEAGGWDPALFRACLCRSHTLTPGRDGFNDVYPTLEQLRNIVRDPIAYRYEYADGLKATIVMLRGLVDDFTVAARLKDGQRISTLMHLPLKNYVTCFHPLINHMEKMFLTGKTPYPVERTLLTTGLTAAGVESLHQDQKRLETPHLAIHYQPPRESTYWRS